MLDPLEDMEAVDGFRVVPQDLGTLKSLLHVALFMKGEWTKPPTVEKLGIPVFEVTAPTLFDMGRRNRVKMLLESLCAYFNASGSWEELTDALDKLRLFVPNGLELEGYTLYDTYRDTQGQVTHVFSKDGTVDAIVWVEGQFIELRPLADIIAEEDDDEEPEPRARPAGHLVSESESEDGDDSEDEDEEEDSDEVS